MATHVVRRLLLFAGALILLFGVALFISGINLFREVADCSYVAYCNPEIIALDTGRVIAMAQSEASLLVGIGILTGAIGAAVTALGLLMPRNGEAIETLVPFPPWWP